LKIFRYNSSTKFIADVIKVLFLIPLFLIEANFICVNYLSLSELMFVFRLMAISNHHVDSGIELKMTEGVEQATLSSPVSMAGTETVQGCFGIFILFPYSHIDKFI